MIDSRLEFSSDWSPMPPPFRPGKLNTATSGDSILPGMQAAFMHISGPAASLVLPSGQASQALSSVASPSSSS